MMNYKFQLFGSIVLIRQYMGFSDLIKAYHSLKSYFSIILGIKYNPVSQFCNHYNKTKQILILNSQNNKLFIQNIIDQIKEMILLNISSNQRSRLKIRVNLNVNQKVYYYIVNDQKKNTIHQFKIWFQYKNFNQLQKGKQQFQIKYLKDVIQPQFDMNRYFDYHKFCCFQNLQDYI
ncbi:hypothetical protein pb186bvf_014272 [Paramecium bursaria]